MNVGEAPQGTGGRGESPVIDVRGIAPMVLGRMARKESGSAMNDRRRQALQRLS